MIGLMLFGSFFDKLSQSGLEALQYGALGILLIVVLIMGFLSWRHVKSSSKINNELLKTNEKLLDTNQNLSSTVIDEVRASREQNAKVAIATSKLANATDNLTKTLNQRFDAQDILLTEALAESTNKVIRKYKKKRVNKKRSTVEVH